MIDKLKLAVDLRNSKNYTESKNLMLELVQEFPEDAYINYQCAWTFDSLGDENGAVPYYEKAINGNLSPQDLENAYLGLGSTYRTIGKYEKSEETFLKGIALFPENQALQTFYAMTLYNLSEHQHAMAVLLEIIAHTSSDSSVSMYQEAIKFYADKLDRTW
ncbi:tetratricopeptide repeat protein [Vagococcus hydrophili]|uniref:Tetratricopeptide repeat protein n=1 Tax=Vagococcus hydrophili TaxID=2714947 RepID=A0A6G8AT57_9ENTE|nr:tetratricopeptide repeat protein [Vagococcus hydrophili]QIL48160.1 tetratricopeptide repeat protein [Vagococcus hydrophili]